MSWPGRQMCGFLGGLEVLINDEEYQCSSGWVSCYCMEYISKSCDKISIICFVHFDHSPRGHCKKKKAAGFFHIHKPVISWYLPISKQREKLSSHLLNYL